MVIRVRYVANEAVDVNVVACHVVRGVIVRFLQEVHDVPKLFFREQHVRFVNAVHLLHGALEVVVVLDYQSVDDARHVARVEFVVQIHQLAVRRLEFRHRQNLQNLRDLHQVVSGGFRYRGVVNAVRFGMNNCRANVQGEYQIGTNRVYLQVVKLYLFIFNIRHHYFF